MPEEKDNIQQYAPSAKKEPRLEYDYLDKDKPISDIQGNLYKTAGSYLLYHAGNYEFANSRYTPFNQNNPDNLPDKESRLEMNKKAHDMAFKNQEHLFNKMDVIEMDLRGMGLLGDNQELDIYNIEPILEEITNKKIPNNSQLDIEEIKNLVCQDYCSYSYDVLDSTHKNMNENHAKSTFAAALKNPANASSDVEMSEAHETSHADRVVRKRSFYSTNGPGYQGYER